MQYQMLLVCHAADGYFGDGNRLAVRRILDRAALTMPSPATGPDRYEICFADGGRFSIHAPGLDSPHPFHRIALHADAAALTPSALALIYDIMILGGFGLLSTLNTCRFIVTSRQQAAYYPHLPEPPHVILSAAELGHVLHESPAEVCA